MTDQPSDGWLSKPHLLFGGTSRHSDPTVNFLSNFYSWPITMEVNGEKIRFNSTECAYQASKFPSRIEITQKFAREDMTGAKAKRLGKKTKLTIEESEAWESGGDVKAMREAVRLKFVKGEELGDKLIKTGEVVLVEESGKDMKWGTVDGKGKNLLGILLMERRKELIEQPEEISWWTRLMNLLGL